VTDKEKLEAIRKVVEVKGAFEYYAMIAEIKRILDSDEREIPDPPATSKPEMHNLVSIVEHHQIENS